MQQTHVPGTYTEPVKQGEEPLWWLLLVTGSLWVLFSILVFRANATTVAAISVLVGTFCIAGAVVVVLEAVTVHGWARAWRMLLAVAFGIIGALAYAHPGNTFSALAAVFAFYLLLRGVFDIASSLMVRGADLWWVGLLAGIVQVLLAFWAAGNFGHKAFLLIVWVGGSALAHGIVDLVTAFRLRPGHGGPAVA